MSFKSIGIIGCGVVGSAVRSGMSHAFNVLTYDKFKEGGCKSIFDLIQRVDGPIFICVSTPMSEDGSCDTSSVVEVVEEIHNVGRYMDRRINVAIKSTVPPGTTYELGLKNHYVNICFNPEFLTERNANEDFKNQDRIIIAGAGDACENVGECYRLAFPDVPVTFSSNSGEAELAKYITNVHLAVKVSLANEFKAIAEAKKIDYDAAVGIAIKDERLGKTHWSVPGPDGKNGFGGTCFPKDINALIAVARHLEINPLIMQAAWEKNLEVRDL